MEFKKVGKSSDYISDCGMFKLIADNDNLWDAYWPTMREGDGQDKSEIFRCLSKEYMSFEGAKKVLDNY